MRTHYYFHDGVNCIACGEIDSMPGCSQLAVFHSSFVLPEFRNQGHGYAAHVDRLECAIDHLYDAAICSVAETNEYQIKNLIKAGWTKVWQFTSSKTQNTVFVFMRNLLEVA